MKFQSSLVPSCQFSLFLFLSFWTGNPFFSWILPLDGSPKPVLDCTDVDKPILTIYKGPCNPAKMDSLTSLCFGFYNLSAEASDNETPSEQIKLEYKIDLYNDNLGLYNGYDIQVGPLSLEEFKKGVLPLYRHNPYAVDSGQTDRADGYYPLGIHKICWFATDSCGNTGALCDLFEIQDCQSPIPEKYFYQFIYPIPIRRVFALNVKEFGIIARDNCSKPGEIYFSFSPEPYDTILMISCDDFFANTIDCYSAELTISIFVIDQAGNFEVVKVRIIIYDLFELCCDLIPRNSISGQILCSSNGKDSVSSNNIYVKCINQHDIVINNYVTDKYYYYGLHDFGNYILNSTKRGSHYDKVSAWDLIKIQQHLLGQNLFTNRFQNFAANVIQDDSINQLDLDQIQKLILHAIDSMESSLDWYIIPVRYNDTLLNGFEDFLKFQMGGNIKRTVDFRLVKMGDVNDYSMPDQYIPPSVVADPLLFTYKNQNYQPKELIQIDLNVREFKNKFGIQGTIQFDTNRLEFIEVANYKLIGMSDACFSDRFAQTGFLTFCWYDPTVEGISLPDTSDIFSLTFKTKSSGDLCDALQMNGSITPLEAYTKNNILTTIKMQCEPVTSIEEVENNKLYVWPNPFTNHLYIVSGKNSKPLTIQLVDLNGSCHIEQSISDPTNPSILNLSTLPSGMYLIRLQDSQQTIVYKIIKNY